MIELGLAALGGLGIGGAVLRWMTGSPAGSVQRSLAVAILGPNAAGGPGAVPR